MSYFALKQLNKRKLQYTLLSFYQIVAEFEEYLRINLDVTAFRFNLFLLLFHLLIFLNFMENRYSRKVQNKFYIKIFYLFFLNFFLYILDALIKLVFFIHL